HCSAWSNTRYVAVATSASTGDSPGDASSALISELLPRLVSPTTTTDGLVSCLRRASVTQPAASGSTSLSVPSRLSAVLRSTSGSASATLAAKKFGTVIQRPPTCRSTP